MSNTLVTVIGNVATGVTFRESSNGGVAWFRFAVPAGRWDSAQGIWVDGSTSFYTVWAWRSLGANLTASVSVGEPLVVHGRLRVREREWEGKRRMSADIDAVAVGHDLTRGTSAFRRVVRASAELMPRQKMPTAASETAASETAPAETVPWETAAWETAAVEARVPERRSASGPERQEPEGASGRRRVSAGAG